jgi:hypothetical protein
MGDYQANEQRVKERKDIVLRANQRYSFLDLGGEDIGDDDISRFQEKLARLIEEKQTTRLRLKVCSKAVGTCAIWKLYAMA